MKALKKAAAFCMAVPVVIAVAGLMLIGRIVSDPLPEGPIRA